MTMNSNRQKRQQITKSLGLWLIAALFTTISAAQPTVIKLNKNNEGNYWVNVTINQQPAQFILDTGATGSVIDSSMLSTFALTPKAEAQSGTGFGDETSSQIQTDTLTLSQFSISGVTTSVKTIYTHPLAHLPEGISGLIGQDVLVDLNAKLEVANALLIIPDNNEIDEFENIQVPIQTSPMGFHYISATLDGSAISLILDTGAPQMVLDGQTLKEMGFKSTPHPTATTIDANGNEMPLHLLPPATLSVGGVTMMADVMLTDMSGLMNALNQSNEPKMVGVLGNTEMTKLGITIDFKNQKLILKSD